jgi:toxin YoeB
MGWKVLILSKAEDDLEWFRRRDQKCYIKCFDLIREIARDPRAGTGKPERLKFFEREVWSRRVSHEHRLIYVVYVDGQQVEIVSCRSHYNTTI